MQGGASLASSRIQPKAHLIPRVPVAGAMLVELWSKGASERETPAPKTGNCQDRIPGWAWSDPSERVPCELWVLWSFAVHLVGWV